MDLETKIEQGIAAAQAGNKGEARRILKEVVKADESQIDAWIWLSSVVYSLDEKIICLENVLTLEPDNQFAQEQLAQAQAAHDKIIGSEYKPLEEDEDQDIETANAPSFSLEAIDLEDIEFSNEWLCPYCLAKTFPADKKCPTCHQPLIIRRRIAEEHTTWLWRTITLQFLISIFYLAAGVSIFMILTLLNQIPNPMSFLPIYFWLPINQAEHLTTQVLTLFPRWVFWGVIFFSLYSFILSLLLYFRAPYGNIIYLVSGCILMSFSFLGTIIFYNSWVGVTVSVITFLLGLAQLGLSRTLWDDFLFEEGRLRLKRDRDAKTSATFFMSGRKYIKLKMWGMALLHLRQAVFMAPQNVTYHATLTLAYMNVNRYDLAKRAIKNLEQIAPNAPELELLRHNLKTMDTSNPKNQEL